MSERLERSKRRKPYKKPHLSRVELVAEEAVLSGCKFENSNIKIQSQPPFCDVSSAGQCYNQSS